MAARSEIKSKPPRYEVQDFEILPSHRTQLREFGSPPGRYHQEENTRTGVSDNPAINISSVPLLTVAEQLWERQPASVSSAISVAYLVALA
jgi:hypothetical protein